MWTQQGSGNHITYIKNGLFIIWTTEFLCRILHQWPNRLFGFNLSECFCGCPMHSAEQLFQSISNAHLSWSLSTADQWPNYGKHFNCYSCCHLQKKVLLLKNQCNGFKINNLSVFQETFPLHRVLYYLFFWAVRQLKLLPLLFQFDQDHTYRFYHSN